MKNNFLRLGQLIFAAIILIFLIYIFLHFAEIQKIPELLAKLKWYYIAALLILELLFLLNRGQIFKIFYNRLGIKLSLEEATSIFTASCALNILVPLAGFSGITLFLNQAKQQGTNRPRVLLINLLFYLINFISLAVLLFFSIIYLFCIGKLQIYYLIGFAILFLIILVFTSIILAYIYKPIIFQFIFEKIILSANFFLKIFKKKIDHEKTQSILAEFKYLKNRINRDKWIFWQPFSLFILGNIYEMVSLYLIFFAFGAYPSLVALITGYSLGLLFMIVSITPAGVGIVEPIMALIFVSLGMPLEISVLTVLIFRAITFWLPLPIGVILMKKYV